MERPQTLGYVDLATTPDPANDVERQASIAWAVAKKLGVDLGLAHYVELEKRYRERCAKKNITPSRFDSKD